ncbi:MAG: hypothetical protein AAB289_10635 [Chloroflexota bacterium]
MFRPGQPVHLNYPVAVDDFGNGTLLLLIERLEASGSFQQYIAREAELDDVWRHVETALKNIHWDGGDRTRAASLQTLLDAVMAAHDLVAEDEPLQAARRLHTIIATP